MKNITKQFLVLICLLLSLTTGWAQRNENLERPQRLEPSQHGYTGPAIAPLPAQTSANKTPRPTDTPARLAPMPAQTSAPKQVRPASSVPSIKKVPEAKVPVGRQVAQPPGPQPQRGRVIEPVSVPDPIHARSHMPISPSEPLRHPREPERVIPFTKDKTLKPLPVQTSAPKETRQLTETPRLAPMPTQTSAYKQINPSAVNQTPGQVPQARDTAEATPGLKSMGSEVGLDEEMGVVPQIRK